MKTKKSARKIGKGGNTKESKTIHERKPGTLRSGSAAKKVTPRKRASAVSAPETTTRTGKKAPSRRASSRRSRSRTSP
jgi:hypothetical protein